MRAKITVILFFLLTFTIASAETSPRWTVKQTNDWYAKQPWLVGSSFIPSTAINQLEMWQTDTFDLPTIDRELGWAQGLGMNTMRVFLHNLLWQEDSKGFLNRMEQFLTVADKHHIRITFVLLDSVWDPYPKLGKQREPRPHVHNSGWMQAPGADILKDPSHWNKTLKPYVLGVLIHFRNDKRILMWDLMNEPDNDNPPYKAQELPDKAQRALALLREEWVWARSAKVSQPLTSGVWKGDMVRRRTSERDRAVSTAQLRRDHVSQLRTSRTNERANSITKEVWTANHLHRIYGATIGKHIRIHSALAQIRTCGCL